MGRDSSCWSTLLQAPASLLAFPRYAPYGLGGRQLLSGTTSMTPVLSGPVMVEFAVGSRALACGHGVWEAEPQTDLPSAPGAQVFQSSLVGDALSCRLQTPFPARRQSLSEEEWC